MKGSTSFLLALCLTCTSGVVAGCAGAKTQEVLLQAQAGTDDDPGGNGTPNGGATDSGTAGDSPAACTPEEEPNDDRDEANTLAPSLCGSLSEDDGKDFLTFRLKPDTTNISITLTGRVRLRVSVPGEATVELTPDSSEDIPFVMDEDYVIEVTALNSRSTVSWRVDLVER